jgi:hypothetical protein
MATTVVNPVSATYVKLRRDAAAHMSNALLEFNPVWATSNLSGTESSSSNPDFDVLANELFRVLIYCKEMVGASIVSRESSQSSQRQVLPFPHAERWSSRRPRTADRGAQQPTPTSSASADVGSLETPFPTYLAEPSFRQTLRRERSSAVRRKDDIASRRRPLAVRRRS